MALTVDRRSALDALTHIPKPIRERSPNPGTVVNVLGERPPTPALEKALSNVGVSLQDDLIRAICEGLGLEHMPVEASPPASAEPVELLAPPLYRRRDEEAVEDHQEPERGGWEEWEAAPASAPDMDPDRELAMAEYPPAFIESEPAPLFARESPRPEPALQIREIESASASADEPVLTEDARPVMPLFAPVPPLKFEATLVAEMRHAIRYEPVAFDFEPTVAAGVDAGAAPQMGSLPIGFEPASAGIEPPSARMPMVEQTGAGIAPAVPPARQARKAPNARAEVRRIRAKALRDKQNEAKRLAALATARTRKSIREEGAERLQILEKALRHLHLDHTMVTYRGCERMIVSWWMAAELVKREGKLSLMKLAMFRANHLRWGPPLPAVDEADPQKRALKLKEWARAGLKKVQYLEREGGPWHRFKASGPDEIEAAEDL